MRASVAGTSMSGSALRSGLISWLRSLRSVPGGATIFATSMSDGSRLCESMSLTTSLVALSSPSSTPLTLMDASDELPRKRRHAAHALHARLGVRGLHAQQVQLR
jgi:hypothetical protein